ncbi:DUF3800 domain-containing protein [Pseudoalteromonas sp. 2CM39R]|uniref:DUF3800 domain-containing protein n=1 Tax=Pseudoalteromonas sp. 2CM39R TaxID=2929856 RepID=UPI0020BDE0EA|nr:DUF3800 domain-containing protein [Pseudoalteromonas sp. 2CM39R]MCK8123922.1 DUF3800 domain-containing protein [Pseudoalteromonas sp. 2CM39R]
MNTKKTKEYPCVYLDESGNTGSNLIDLDQPVFTLAGCSYSKEESERLLALLNVRSANEAHFKRLKRRKAGQDAIIRLLKDPAINTNNIKINLFHKRFMVITKIVDVLIEYLANLDGHDLYKNGENIALSNMLYCCLPALCGEENTDILCKLFVDMVKNSDTQSIEKFYSHLNVLVSSSKSDSFVDILNLIQATQMCVYDALSHTDKTALDPAIPAFFEQCVKWGEQYESGFDVMHDDSQTLERKQSLLEKYMDWSKDEQEIGYDRRKFKLPLKTHKFEFVSSELHPQIQVSDILASSVAYWVEGTIRGEENDYFFLELNKLNLKGLITGFIWPSSDVSPSDLGTEFDGGLNPADHAADFIHEQ